VADTAVSDVWRLRSRGCWGEAVRLLDDAEAGAETALRRTELLVERCVYTSSGWAEAEDALRGAEATARTDEERGAAACERGFLAYASTFLGVRDRADEARAALGRGAALLGPDAAGRPLLDFRRGLIAQNLAGNASAARVAFRRAHAAAAEQGDDLLCAHTWRHLAVLAQEEGDLTEARHGFAESLRLCETLGYMIGAVPALAALAEVESPESAPRFRTEATRLFHLLGGIPVWLTPHLGQRAT
jgi:tetratricopeptide (TPR) repeat protein